jgi:hypothetical protein
MTEETAIFGRMVFGERCFCPWGVTGLAEFFCLFLFHGHETFMVLVMRQRCRGFRRGVKEKEENAAAACQKKTVVQNIFLFGRHGNNPVRI